MHYKVIHKIKKLRNFIEFPDNILLHTIIHTIPFHFQPVHAILRLGRCQSHSIIVQSTPSRYQGGANHTPSLSSPRHLETREVQITLPHSPVRTISRLGRCQSHSLIIQSTPSRDQGGANHTPSFTSPLHLETREVPITLPHSPVHTILRLGRCKSHSLIDHHAPSRSPPSLWYWPAKSTLVFQFVFITGHAFNPL